MQAQLSRPVADLLAPYLDVVRSHNERDALTVYPGSPGFVRAWLRAEDRLIACELEPEAFAALRHAMRGDARIKMVAIDGWTALQAYVPPKERRGLVVVDPPFEREDEFRRLADGFAAAYRKWPTGSYLLWYPIKGRSEPDAFAKRLRRLEIPKILRAELMVAPLRDPSRLNGSGLVLINPPWTLEGELRLLLPALAGLLGRDGAGRFTLNWLAEEAVR
jgi:23S rRNA (adenine2030-N6)-methyltransferase